MRRHLVFGMTMLGFLALFGPVVAQEEPGRDKVPGDKRNGEEEEIRMREEWFAERRGLGDVDQPGALRRQAVEEVKFRLTQPDLRVVPGSWQEVGPSPMNMLTWAMGRVAGRVSALAVSPADEQVLYLGTASGGLWKSVNGGGTWTSLFDAVGTQTIGSVALDPNDSNVVWVGTGEQGQSCFGYFGMGLFRSTDGGASFAPRNGSGGSALALSHVTAVAVQPGNSNVILAGGSGFCSGGVAGSAGLFRSNDGGATWSKVLNGQTQDIIFDPTVPSLVYAAVGGSSTTSGGVFRSNDGGATWTQLTNGIPFGLSGRRVRLAMAPTNRQVLYALVKGTGNTAALYRTLDGGTTWTQRNSSTCDGQCSYNLTLAVSPASSDTLLVGAIRVWRSTNGGTSLTALTATWGSSQRVHQDTHVVRYSRTNGNRFWVGSDGGLWRSDDGGTNYANLNANLNITQFYDIAVHPTDSNRIFGGAQDNSSAARSASQVWDVVTVTGDGFTNAVDPGNTNYVFIESYPNNGPSIYRSTNGGGVNSFSRLPTTGITSGVADFPWKTELVIIPAGANSFLVTGSSFIYRANARQATVSWTRISNSISGTGVSVSSFGPAVGSTLYAGFSNGRIFRTDDVLAATVTWTEVTGNYPGNVVSDLAVDPTDRLRVFATRSAFGGAKLFRSTTGGTTWAAVGSGLPDVPANSVAVDPLNRQRIFVATDVGVFVSEDGGDTFAPQMSGLPQGTVVMDLEIDDAPHVLTAGTYGRGAWRLTLP